MAELPVKFRHLFWKGEACGDAFFLRAKVVSLKKMCIFAILFRLLPRGGNTTRTY